MSKMTGCRKGCQQGEGCMIWRNKDKSPICPCKECLVKSTCMKQCMDRRHLFHSDNIKEYYDNREGIHLRLSSKTHVIRWENMHEFKQFYK